MAYDKEQEDFPLPAGNNNSITSATFLPKYFRTDGTLWSWGMNNNGQLGLGSTTYYSSPKQVGSSTTWLLISASGRSSLALG